MKGRDIVMMSLQHWGDALGSNSYNLAMEFAKQNRILYVNRAPDRIGQLKNIFKKNDSIPKKEWISSPLDNIYVLDTQAVMESINWMPTKAFQYFNCSNGKKIAKEIKRATDQLGMTDVVLFIDNDFIRGLYLKELLNASMFIYYIRDNLRTHPYFSRHGKFCEERIAAKADLVVANSPFLAALLRPFNEHSHDIGQGCDFNLFQEYPTPKPDDFPENEKPTIGYVGNIVSYRLDLKLLESICKKNTQWNWLFVGPVDEFFSKSCLQQLPNVYFTGSKPEKEIWKYIYHIDVCINPQRINGMTEGNYPRKIDEYLYMGKPVVATNTAFMSGFSDQVLLFEDEVQFEKQLKKAIAEPQDISIIQERKHFASSHSWSNCTEKIYSLMKIKDYA